ncbi:MAG: hypothetical protein HZA79_09870 [Sphingobacteriales bacterium]|nr:hypothetical protein [Sphingobacteriales bacterium]
MATNSIVHFVGFVTRLESEKFIPAWEDYARKEMFRKREPLLLQQDNGSRNRFRFLSQHIWPEGESHFSFKKNDKSGYFHELPVQVVHIGGYLPMEMTKNSLHKDSDSRLLVMAGHNENDPGFYQSLPYPFRLNSYQAYFESCIYGYIFEYFAAEKEMEEITNCLKQRPGTERVLYKDCLVPHF